MIFGLVLDGLVALLMFATIVFCFRLNRRLASFRGVQAEMKGLVSSFVAATERAELGVARLRAAAEDSGDTLQERLEGARAVADELAFLSESCARLAERLEREPDDFPGWLRLARAYGVLGEAAQARDALSRAEAAIRELPEDAPERAQLEAARNDLPTGP